MSTTFRKTAGLVWTQDPAAVVVRKVSAVAFANDVGLTLRNIQGYAFEIVPPSVTLRSFQGYAFETALQAIPMSKTGDLSMYDLINNNRSVTTTFSATNTTLGSPTALSQPDANGHNTSVVLSAKPGFGYAGSITFYYKRRPISDLSPASLSLGTIAADTSIHALLATINSKYGWSITAQDVVDAPVSAGALGVILNAADASWLFIPGTQITVGQHTSLSAAVSNQALAGFDSPIVSLSSAVSVTALPGFDNAAGVGPSDSWMAAVMADAPYAYYRLNESTGTEAIDSSGNGRHGTYSGALTQAGNALSISRSNNKYVVLPGSNTSFIDVTAAKNFCSGATWTIEALIQPTSYAPKGGYGTSGATILTDVGDTGSTTPGTGLEASIVNGMYFWQMDNKEIGPATGQGFPTLGAMTHAVWTFNAGTMNMYVNGELVLSQTGVTNATIRSFLRIGAGAWVGGAFTGAIGEVALYSTELTAAQVRNHYLGPDSNIVSGPSDLLLHMDSVVSGTGFDSSGGHTSAGLYNTASLNTSAKAFGASSAQLAAATDCIYVNAKSTGDLQTTADMTLEMYVARKVATPTGVMQLATDRNPGTAPVLPPSGTPYPSAASFNFYTDASGNLLADIFGQTAVSLDYNLINGLPTTIGSFVNLVFQVKGLTLTVFVDGLIVASYTGTTRNAAQWTPQINVGNNPGLTAGNTQLLFDEIRFSRFARYNGQFVLRGAPYTNTV